MRVLGILDQNNCTQGSKPSFKMNLTCKKGEQAYEILKCDFDSFYKVAKNNYFAGKDIKFEDFFKSLQNEVSNITKTLGDGIITFVKDPLKERGSLLKVNVTADGKTLSSERCIALNHLLPAVYKDNKNPGHEGANEIFEIVSNILLKK